MVPDCRLASRETDGQRRTGGRYQYSSFCDHYRAWAGRLSLSLRQTHAPGEKLFVDYAGPTVPVTDPMTGEIRAAAIFVAVLGASNYTYCDATWSQTLPDWTASHVRAFEFFGGTPAILVPDNLKSGVNKACVYDPQLGCVDNQASQIRAAAMEMNASKRTSSLS